MADLSTRGTRLALLGIEGPVCTSVRPGWASFRPIRPNALPVRLVSIPRFDRNSKFAYLTDLCTHYYIITANLDYSLDSIALHILAIWDILPNFLFAFHRTSLMWKKFLWNLWNRYDRCGCWLTLTSKASRPNWIGPDRSCTGNLSQSNTDPSGAPSLDGTSELAGAPGGWPKICSSRWSSRRRQHASIKQAHANSGQLNVGSKLIVLLLWDPK
jgi:hypothetical protein